jgi:hypothetical protein
MPNKKMLDQIKQEDFEKRAEKAQKEIKNILTKYQIALVPQLNIDDMKYRPIINPFENLTK